MNRFKFLYGLIIVISGAISTRAQEPYNFSNLDFWGKNISFNYENPVIQSFKDSGSIDIEAKRDMELSDWLTYQLIRKCANVISPKSTDFNIYTLTKANLLENLGYAPLVGWNGKSFLLYIKTNDEIFNLPIKLFQGENYVCINYHDFNYGESVQFAALNLKSLNHEKGKYFRFSISSIPTFPQDKVTEKILQFQYKSRSYTIPVMVNQELRNYFTNYPVTSYESQFNIPINDITGTSLINNLKVKLKNLPVKKGVELLMNFTRTAFDFANDTEVFGREKRLSPEETLLYEKSDCEDRAALFYYLVKEIYNLPMIVLSYPDHVNVGVELDGKGYTINYDNKSFTVCEPTPQKKNLPLGKIQTARKKNHYEIAYAYNPVSHNQH
ncbi:MAG: hypothetical protein RLZZ172_1264 [Bacteroidota bacterium]|jgi:hypothetical protein